MKIAAKTNQRGNRLSAGFTLTEVAVSTAIFAIAFVAAYWGIMQGSTLVQTTRENERATEILLDKAEVLRLYTWDQLTNIAFTPLAFTNTYNPSGKTNGTQGPKYFGSVTITNAPLTEGYAVDMKLLTFQVNWTNNELSHQRQLMTLVSRYGVHNYIYGPTN